MSRTARVTAAGYPMHIWQRGNNRSTCFSDESDLRLYLALLAKSASREGCSIHAYVLMTNHVHMLATGQAADGVSRMTKWLGECYVKAFNKRHRRSGTLWEGRFKSSVVDSDRYFLTCQRYIELNPVRAGMVGLPGDYPWSSFRANAWGETSFVQPHPVYLGLASSSDRRLLCYRRLFDRPIADAEVAAIRRALKGNFAIGGKEFIVALESLQGRPVTARSKGRPGRVQAEERREGNVSLLDN